MCAESKEEGSSNKRIDIARKDGGWPVERASAESVPAAALDVKPKAYHQHTHTCDPRSDRPQSRSVEGNNSYILGAKVTWRLHRCLPSRSLSARARGSKGRCPDRLGCSLPGRVEPSTPFFLTGNCNSQFSENSSKHETAGTQTHNDGFSQLRPPLHHNDHGKSTRLRASASWSG